QTALEKAAAYFASCMGTLSLPLNNILKGYVNYRRLNPPSKPHFRRYVVEAALSFQAIGTSVVALSWGPSIKEFLNCTCEEFLAVVLTASTGAFVRPGYVRRVIELDERLAEKANLGKRTEGTSKQYNQKTLAEVLGHSHGDVLMWHTALNDTGVEGPYIFPNPQHFIAALNYLVDSEHHTEVMHLLLLRILQTPLRDSYITSSWKEAQHSDRIQALCREKLFTKFLAPWNILAIRTLTNPSSLQDTNAIFDTAKLAITNYVRTSTDLERTAKDRIMDKLLLFGGNLPVLKDHGGYISYRYRNVPDMSAEDMYANEWELLRHDTSCRQRHRLLCGPFQDEQRVAISHNELTLTAALQQAPFLYSDSKRFLNTATVAYVILLRMLEGILSPVEDPFTPTSRKRCLQLQLDQGGVSGLLPFPSMYVIATALRIAYDMEQPKARTDEEEPEAVMEDQLFFLRACLLFCNANNSSLARAKCNGAVQNMPEFYRAFWCPAQRKMPQLGVCQLK
ncbi:unnamed protein product, partial [Ixodes hexagonus]